MYCYFIKFSKKIARLLEEQKMSGHFYKVTESVDGFTTSGYLFSQATWRKVFEDNGSRGARLLQASGGPCDKWEISDDDREECASRLLYSLESYLQDPPPREVLEEFHLLLLANKRFCIEYIGRNVAQGDCPHLSQADLHVENTTFYFDIFGGRRRYLWRSKALSAREFHRDPRHSFDNFRRWLDDGESRVVLSLGCGALRLLAIPTVLKVLDLIGAREYIDEVWGNSGGAIVGHLYASGIAPHYIEQIGYDIYNHRYPEHCDLKRSKIDTAISTAARFIKSRGERSGLLEIQTILTSAIEKIISGRTTLNRQKLPFFAVAMNVNQEKIYGLTKQELIPTGCEDFLLGCDPLRAVAASSAIPFLFKGEVLETSNNRTDVWHDAILGEDLPLLVPYKKWRVETQNNESTHPRRLKVFYVDLGLHYFEYFLSQKFEQVPGFQWIGKFMKMTHASFEGRAGVQKDYLRLTPDVDLIGVKLELDRAALFDVAMIPTIIQTGRKNLLDQLLEIDRQLGERPQQNKRSLKAVS